MSSLNYYKNYFLICKKKRIKQNGFCCFGCLLEDLKLNLAPEIIPG